jgi:flagellar biosynthesis/type III secretory pathway M-ring protein FliF/YscJ
MLMLQGTEAATKTAEGLLERHGLAVAFLFVVCVALYLVVRYVVVPLVNRLLSALEKQIEEARLARKEDQSEFLDALKARDQVNRENTDAIRQLTARIDDMARRTN